MRWITPSKKKIRVRHIYHPDDWDDVEIPGPGYYWLEDSSSGEWRICFVDRVRLDGDLGIDATGNWGVELEDQDGWRIDVRYLRRHLGICGPLDPPEDLPE